jgi:hypothetical protein
MSEGMLQLVLGQLLNNQAAIMIALSKHQDGATKEMLVSHARATDTVLNVLKGVGDAAEQPKS